MIWEQFFDFFHFNKSFRGGVSKPKKIQKKKSLPLGPSGHFNFQHSSKAPHFLLLPSTTFQVWDVQCNDPSLIHWIYMADCQSHVCQVPRFWFLFWWCLVWSFRLFRHLDCHVKMSQTLLLHLVPFYYYHHHHYYIFCMHRERAKVFFSQRKSILYFMVN